MAGDNVVIWSSVASFMAGISYGNTVTSHESSYWTTYDNTVTNHETSYCTSQDNKQQPWNELLHFTRQEEA